jgi:DNA-binding MarR family transcriptional regulator
VSRELLISELIDHIRANQVLTDLLDEKAAEYLGINRTDARAVDVIDQHGRISAGELARELRMSTGAVTTLVDRLERAGYARRVPDPEDRRRVLIEVTPVVDENTQKIYGTIDEAVPLYDDYTDADLELLVRFHRMGRDWLEGRLARVDELASEPRRARGRQSKPSSTG